jgi:hypothetical protein
MADTGFFSWGPGDTFRASVFALNDRAEVLKGSRIRVRVYDRAMQLAYQEDWATDVPSGGYASEGRDVHWPIPANTPEGYLFFELTLSDAQGARLSRRMYWLRILQMLVDPEARKRWQAAPVAEPLNQSGPWLKPQIEGFGTSLQATIKIESQSQKEAELSVAVENVGKLPAYPVRLQLAPDVYSVIWSDNYFWLAPGEKSTLHGTMRLNMNGLDPITKPPAVSPGSLRVRVSAWNAPVTELIPRS